MKPVMLSLYFIKPKSAAPPRRPFSKNFPVLPRLPDKSLSPVLKEENEKQQQRQAEGKY